MYLHIYIYTCIIRSISYITYYIYIYIYIIQLPLSLSFPLARSLSLCICCQVHYVINFIEYVQTHPQTCVPKYANRKRHYIYCAPLILLGHLQAQTHRHIFVHGVSSWYPQRERGHSAHLKPPNASACMQQAVLIQSTIYMKLKKCGFGVFYKKLPWSVPEGGLYRIPTADTK